MAAQQHLEETWGVAAPHAEHHIDDYVRYSVEGEVRSGTIIWICAAANEAGPLRSVRYVIQPDDGAKGADLVWPGNILIGEAQQPLEPACASTELEQALLKMLATLSIPVVVTREIDDAGQPYYVWRIGESTPAHPWGLYVGIDRQFIGALKLALEKLISHQAQQQQPAPEA
jgi:hypothetical protein